MNIVQALRVEVSASLTNSSSKSATVSPWPFVLNGVAATAMARDLMLHRLVGVSLVAAVLALAPAAHASPPDQSWIPGLYDDADFDDVVLLITSNLGAIQPALVWSLRPGGRAVGLVTPTDTEPRPLFPLSSVLGRAPPLA